MPNPPSTPDYEFAMLFSSTRHSASTARRIAGRRLQWWGVDPRTPSLLVGELTANAVIHCRPRKHRDFFLRLAISGGTLRVEVADSCPDCQPELRKPADDAEGGRGLILVDHLSSGWGVTVRPTGKTVWCELPATGPLGPGPAAGAHQGDG